MVKQTSVKAPMTKDRMMQYTFIALCILAAISYISFGVDSLIISVISVLVAIACDFLLSLVMGKRGPFNMWSAAVFGLIVAMSYTLGEAPVMQDETFSILGGAGLDKYLYPALISAVGLIVFKKILGLAGRKYLNPAAIAKLLIIGLLFMPTFSALMPVNHTDRIDLQNRMIESQMEGIPDVYPMNTSDFGYNIVSCYGDPNADPNNPYVYGTYEDPLPDVVYNLLVQKYHSWIGGVSSIAVIVVGIALFAVLRRYIKWRITLAYLVTTLLFSVVMHLIYGGDPLFRILFHLFMGSSIFLAFFMATDPATTPLTHLGQIIFGAGLAILTIIIQTYTGFLGGSILALVIMNLTCPLLDRIGVPKALTERTYCAKLPKAKKFTSVRTTECIRCGSCLYVCSGRIPTISVKEAADKGNWTRVEKLGAGYCQQCGTCSFVCPARIDLKAAMLVAREKVGAKPLKSPTKK